jgi:hypothetical protein
MLMFVKEIKQIHHLLFPLNALLSLCSRGLIITLQSWNYAFALHFSAVKRCVSLRVLKFFAVKNALRFLYLIFFSLRSLC